MQKEYSLAELATKIDCELIGSSSLKIDGVASLELASNKQVSFLANEAYLPLLANTKAAAVIINANLAIKAPGAVLVSKNPYLSFAKLTKLFATNSKREQGIHESVVIGNDTKIANSAHIAPYCVIGNNVTIGEGVTLLANVVIGDNCSIGINTVIWPNVVIYYDVNIGENCIIHSGAVIGSDGFGFARDHKGSYEKVEQLGGVIISSQVEIGANTTIDRGTLSNTHIGFGVKIDSQVQIAHNVKIGEHTVIAGCVGIAGSAEIGSHCMIGGASGVAGHVKIASGVILTGMAMATKSIKKAGIYSSGTGILENSKWRKNAVYFRNMESLQKRLEKLEQALLKK